MSATMTFPAPMLAKTYEGQDVVARLLARLDRRRVEEDRLCAEAERDLRAGDYAGYQEKEAARWKSRKRGRGLVMAALLLERVEKAARQLRYQTASFREADGFQRVPRAVLDFAVGLFKRDARHPVNRKFFETVPRLAAEG